MSETIVVAVVGVIAAVIGAIGTAIVQAGKAGAEVRRSEVDRLQDVIEFYHSEVTGLMERVKQLEQNAAHDARENDQLRRQIKELQEELCQVREAHATERAEWAVERKQLEARIAELEQKQVAIVVPTEICDE